MFRTFLLLVVALSATPAGAEVFCVGDGPALQLALDSAEANGQDDQIRVRVGSLTAPAGGFAYFAVDDGDLAISGGWTAFFDNPCAFQSEPDPGATVLVGNDGSVLRIVPAQQGTATISLRRLAFVGGDAEVSGGGLSLGGVGVEFGGQVLVERNLFIGNSAQYDAAIGAYWVARGSGLLRLANNLVVSNTGSTAITLALSGDTSTASDAGVQLINNTVVNNPDGGIIVKGTAPQALLANNNLHGNGDFDLWLFETGARLISNNIGQRVGAAPEHESGTLSVDPDYEPGCQLCFDRVPRLDSSLVDAGAMPRAGAGWSLVGPDYRGRDRIDGVGKMVDIGAFENHVRLFSDDFEGAAP